MLWDYYLENCSSCDEQNHDDKGIIWPSAISPFEILIIVLNDKDDSNVMDQAMNIYDELRSDGIEVAIDDRDERAGVKFADADLLGVPLKSLLGKGLEQNKLRSPQEAQEKKRSR